MNENIENCRECNEPFYVVEFKLSGAGNKEREEITCPYCGFTRTRMINGSFRVTALSEEEREKVKKQN